LAGKLPATLKRAFGNQKCWISQSSNSKLNIIKLFTRAFSKINAHGSLATELSFRTFAPAAEQKLTASTLNLERLAQHNA
jgi:hypothetical protein